MLARLGRNAAAKFDSLPVVQRRRDAAEQGVDDDLGALLREIGGVGHLLHERRLRQVAVDHGFVCRQKGAVVAARARELQPGDDPRGRMIAAAGW